MWPKVAARESEIAQKFHYGIAYNIYVFLNPKFQEILSRNQEK
jgi:hypothetical protein